MIVDVDEIFRPITKAVFHSVPDKTEPARSPPTKDDVGINLLNKSLRDITGMLLETLAEHLCRSNQLPFL